MDHRPIVKPPARSTHGPIQADYAIFTSVRTPMGNGYQLAAASKGVSHDEKAELKRRSPSHNALCSSELDTKGISAYPLSSGRYVVALSRYGNVEYSGRGGRCIDTHIVLLTPDDYAAFDCNPLRVQEALVAVIGNAPVTKPPRQLDPLKLSMESQTPGHAITEPPSFGTSLDPAWLTHLAKWLLTKRPIIITGIPAPLSALEWTLMTLPAGWRRDVAISAGIKYAMTRELNWVVLDDQPTDLKRVIGGHDIGICSIGDPIPSDPHALDEWFHFVERWWQKKHHVDLCSLTAHYPESDVSLEDLKRIIGMLADLDIARLANAETRARLHETYANWPSTRPIEQQVAGEISDLTMPEDEKESAQGSPPPPLRSTSPLAP